MIISSISKKYNITINGGNDLISLIDKHGFDILRTGKNGYYSIYEKERIINRVILDNGTIRSVAIDNYIYYYNYGRIKGKLKDYIL